MRYPKPLHTGDTIGICAPSSGVTADLYPRLDRAIANLRALGYEVRETPSVRKQEGYVSGDAQTRAREFMALYEDPEVALILPPWGGEFLMDMLPLLDFDRLTSLPPKWISGYSDLTTLTFALTLRCDMATVHGANLMNMGYKRIHPSDMALLEAISRDHITQHSANQFGSFDHFMDLDAEPYLPMQESVWRSLSSETAVSFSGRVIGGCMDTICKLIGTPYAPIAPFIEKYGRNGILWALESCEMNPPEIYRALWQMRQCGWFDGCAGVLLGRPDGCTVSRNYSATDAYRQAFEGLSFPILYDADIGHIPPQMQLINGAVAEVSFEDSKATVTQTYTE